MTGRGQPGRLIIIAIAATFLGGCSKPPETTAGPSPTPEGLHSVRNGWTGPIPPKPPRIYKIDGQPKNAEEQAMVNWFTYMAITDDGFEWRSPIDFYGVALDEEGRPVRFANVDFGWNSLKGSEKASTRTGVDGRFELTGKQGKVLEVLVYKEGYSGGGSDDHQCFEYSAFYKPNYYTPDKDHPVVFKLTDLSTAEPMLRWHADTRIPLNGTKVWYDVATGKFGLGGQIAFSTLRMPENGDRMSDWEVTIETEEGGGVIERPADSTFLHTAPAEGYQRRWRKEYPMDARGIVSDRWRFYFKTPEAKYGYLTVEISQDFGPSATVSVISDFNPSGSRNVRFDDAKQINPR